MYENALRCPSCGAGLAPSRFARSVTCGHCGTAVQLDPSVVSVARYRDALAAWRDPENAGYRSWSWLGEGAWFVGSRVARGESSDLHEGARARWPGERVLVKLLRDASHRPLLDRENAVLSRLGAQDSPMVRRLPMPVAHGVFRAGNHAGRAALILRPAHGYRSTLEQVRRARGLVDAASSVWVWRRVLELLEFLHRAGVAHGAVLPPHVLIQDGEHGARLAGYSCAGAFGAALPALNENFEAIYPATLLRGGLSPGADLQMSARTILWAIGGDPASGRAPAGTPEAYARLLRAAAHEGGASAWALREAAGEAAFSAFGAPAFRPLISRPSTS